MIIPTAYLKICGTETVSFMISVPQTTGNAPFTSHQSELTVYLQKIYESQLTVYLCCKIKSFIKSFYTSYKYAISSSVEIFSFVFLYTKHQISFPLLSLFIPNYLHLQEQAERLQVLQPFLRLSLLLLPQLPSPFADQAVALLLLPFHRLQ